MILDTCGLIWLATGSKELSVQAREAISRADIVYVSTISAFEIGLKYARGELDLPCDPERWYLDVLSHHGLTEIPLDGRVAVASTKLPLLHRDPCDRFIIATAKLLHLPVVTGDGCFDGYGIEIIR
jgi:PIN domain nuclease of toxin-antitoxin system